MSAGISIMDLAKRKQVTAKLGKMRKPQTFTVYPKQEGDTTIIVQSDKSIGEFDYVTGEGSLCTRGCYFMHLSLGSPFLFPPAFVKEARAIWDGGAHMEEGRKLHEAIETIAALPAPLRLEIDELSAAVAGREVTITIKPYRNGLHGVRVLGSAGVPRTGAHFARWNKS